MDLCNKQTFLCWPFSTNPFGCIVYMLLPRFLFNNAALTFICQTSQSRATTMDKMIQIDLIIITCEKIFSIIDTFFLGITLCYESCLKGFNLPIYFYLPFVDPFAPYRFYLRPTIRVTTRQVDTNTTRFFTGQCKNKIGYGSIQCQTEIDPPKNRLGQC